MHSKVVPQQAAIAATSKWRRLVTVSGYWKALIILFLLTLPFLHGEVEGDGVGYYAYLRSPLIDRNLAFATDWKDPHEVDRLTFATDWKDPHEVDRTLVKQVWENPVRRPGHLPNYFTVGPAILWSPFLVSTHVVVLTLSHLGVHVIPDGKSQPYMGVMAMATALYGFAGLCISFSIARRFVDERWAFCAVVGSCLCIPCVVARSRVRAKSDREDFAAAFAGCSRSFGRAAAHVHRQANRVWKSLCRWTIFSASMELECAGIWKGFVFRESRSACVYSHCASGVSGLLLPTSLESNRRNHLSLCGAGVLWLGLLLSWVERCIRLRKSLFCMSDAPVCSGIGVRPCICRAILA